MAIFTNISKIDVAKREIDHAIRLFFNNGDIVVVHLLASAAEDILSGMGKSMGIISIKEDLKKSIKKDKVNEVMRKINAPYNFFKHGTRDKDQLLKFSAESSELVLYDAVNMYLSITKELPGLMFAYRSWFYLKNKEIILDPLARDTLDNIDLDVNNRSLFLELAETFENKRAS